MASGLKDVHIVITREIARITRRGFGKPLLVNFSENKAYADCLNMSDVEDAGWDSNTAIHKMATAVFRQTPSPREIAVYGRHVNADGEDATAVLENSAGDGLITITADTALSGSAGNEITVKFEDTEEGGISSTYDAGEKTLTIDFGGADATCAAIETEINTNATNFTADTTQTTEEFTIADDLTVTAVTSGGYDDYAGGIGVAMYELLEDHNDWYFLLSDENDDQGNIKALSDFAAGNGKLYFASPDMSVANYIVLAKKLNTERAVLIYNDEVDEYADAAWVGKCAPTDPGSITWKFKSLDGVTVPDLTTTEVNALHNAHVNTYVSKLGVQQTSEGMTTKMDQSGYIDVVRGQDWVEARMSERVHYLLFTNPKVPFDNRGIGLVKGEVEAVLQWATTRGIVAVDNDGNGMFEVSVPDRADTDPVDRANRILKDVRFEFDLAGAIHEVRIAGVIRI